MRRDRLLNAGDRGSAVVESIAAMLFVLVISLGLVQTALTLYARNIVISSAHEGARAAVELGRDPADATAVARQTIESSTRGLVNDLSVNVAIDDAPNAVAFRVDVSADLRAIGPIPIEIPVSSTATAFREARP